MVKLKEINAFYNKTTCDICNDEGWTDNNKIVICELCNVHVHQACYGSQLSIVIPEGPWYCQRCQHLLDTKTNPEDVR